MNIVKLIELRAKTEGVAESTQALKGLAKAQDDVGKSGAANARITDTATKSQLSMEKALQGLERRFVTGVRAQQDFEKVQRQLNLAVSQNPALQARANKVLEEARSHFDKGINSATKMQTAVAGLTAQLGMLSARAGPVGQVLSAIGPAGVAAAAGIGAIIASMVLATRAANQFADEMGRLRDTAQLVGLTTDQLQALNDAGSAFALTEEKISSSLSRFTAEMEKAQMADGELFKQIQRLDPALATQLVLAKDNAEALEVYAQALQKAGVGTAQFAALAKAGLGKTGFDVGQLLASIVSGGGSLELLTQQFARSGDRIDKELIERVRTLKREVDDTAGDAQRNFASIFSEPLLQAQLSFYTTIRDISRELKQMAPGQAFQEFMDWLIDPRLIAVLKALTNLRFKEAFDIATTAPLPSLDPGGLFGQKAPEPFKMTVNAADNDNIKENTKQLLLNLDAQKQRMALLGDAASLQERHNLKVAELSAAFATNGGAVEDYNRALAVLNKQLELATLEALIAQLGDAATEAQRLAAALLKIDIGVLKGEIGGADVGAAKQAAITASSKKVADDAISKEQKRISLLGDAATATEKYALKVMELEQANKEGTLSQEDFNRALKAANPLFKMLEDAAVSFTQSFVSGMLEGKSVTDSLVDSLDNISKSLISGGIEKIIKSGGTDIVGWGMAAVGTITQIFTGQQKAAKKAAEDLAQAKQEWADMAGEFNRFIAEMKGAVSGFADSIGQAEQAMSQFTIAANKAGDQASVTQAQNAFNEFVSRSVNEFVVSFDDMNEAMRSGLGMGSPIIEAQKNVREMGKTLLGFVEDTNAVFQLLGDSSSAVAQARESAIAYALSLLHVQKPMDETASKIAALTGSAEVLVGVLVQLGASAEDAGMLVRKHLVEGLQELAASFTTNLERRINELAGGGWVNDLLDLATEFSQLSANAAKLGVGQSLVDTFLGVSAQKIINDAQLTGEAFQRVLLLFPQLAGVVKEFSEVLARSAAEIAQAQQSYQDQLFILMQDQSTLAGQLAVFDLQAQRQREEEIARGGQALVALEALLAAQRLDIIKRYNAQILAAQQQALNDAKNFLATFANNIKSWLAGVLGSASSPLSPAARLAQAQSAFTTQFSIASTGSGQAQRDALNSITQYANTLLEAAKDYFGSSTGFQSIFNAVTGQLGGLPAQIDPSTLIINAIDATTSAVETMQSALTAVLNTGNLQSIASTLLSYLPSIDTNTDLGISFAEMQAALGGTYSAGTLRGIFNELDGNGNGILEKAELTKIATQSTATSTAGVDTDTSNLLGIKSDTAATVTSLLALAQISNNTQSTANSVAGTNGHLVTVINTLTTINNNIVNSNANPVLELIRLNLRTQNSAWSIPNNAGTPNSALNPISQFAAGGWITGGAAGRDSVPIVGMPGEFVVRRSVAQANADWLPSFNAGSIPFANDNMVAALADIKAELAALRQEASRNSRSNAAIIAGSVEEGMAMTAAAVGEISRKQKRERAA